MMSVLYSNLAKGQVKAEQVFPVNSKSQILVPYQIKGVDGTETKNVNLGHLQAKIEATLSGSVGASVMLAANVSVDTSAGLPKIKGQHTGIDGKFEAFAGIRGGCEVKGSLSWADKLAKDSDWKQLCLIGKKVEGAFGVGAEADITITYRPRTGKFLLRVHAGLVFGVGASGSFVLEIDPKHIVVMIHFVYNALREVDFRQVKIFDESGFLGFQNLCLMLVLKEVNYWGEFIDSGIDLIDSGQRWVESIVKDLDREEEAYNVAKRINGMVKGGGGDIILHSPPETKGILLDLLLFDPSGIWEWPSDDKEKHSACVKILNTVQGEREYLEILSRMNPKAEKKNNNRDENARRLFAFLDLGEGQREKFEKRIRNKVAPTDGAVKYDPTEACLECGINS